MAELAMRLPRVTLHGFLTNMRSIACAWENLDFAQMHKGISVHFLFGGKLLSRVFFFSFFFKGMERDYERAAEAYMHAKSQSNAQAMFNLGYMHEHGQGLPFDLHLAQRYYDQAQEVKMMGSLEWCPFHNMSNGVELGMAPSC
ncbi:hypothetical protein GH714_023231 [Hevea brasiliensis]|uniref:Uncharacterized protein n=1 Tax=Hevea brasiliensis TaxID=3981 RepID=A0A6A6MUG3_HEVBR|nr:hypothetical protein GH714_023231 [Hevea brasiliensis]